jgi:isocitrate dehydrogenase (NAD+)
LWIFGVLEMTDVTLVTGDGIGPEIAEATRRCIDATGADINWSIAEAGVDVMERLGTPLPDETVEMIKKTGTALKAPITTPVGKGFRSINVHLRQSLDLYACLRPCKSYEGVRSRYTDIDLVVVRENTEDCYAGVEFQSGKDDTDELINWINKHSEKRSGKNPVLPSNQYRSKPPKT